MSNFKRVIPCIFIQQGKAIKWFDNNEVIDEDVVALAFCTMFFVRHGDSKPIPKKSKLEAFDNDD